MPAPDARPSKPHKRTVGSIPVSRVPWHEPLEVEVEVEFDQSACSGEQFGDLIDSAGRVVFTGPMHLTRRRQVAPADPHRTEHKD